MKIMLALKYDPQPAQAAAWLIPGADVQAWLTEVARLNVPHHNLQLLVIGARNAAPLGLLVMPPTGTTIHAPAAWQAYRVEADRVYWPLEGNVHPPLAAGELSKLLPSPDAIYVWHPTLGLTGYETNQRPRISDLLLPPAERLSEWNRAEPGDALAKRLISIEPEQTLTLADIMQQSRDDIGNSAGALDKLPKHPDERSAMQKAAQSALGGAAKAMQWAASNLPGMAPGGMLGPLQEWARQQVEQLAQSLSVERNKELARLLRMLDDNPDEGLRFALPLAGDAAPRGLARPGTQLQARDPDFNLGRLGGGGAVDGWDAGAYRTKLMQRYRELANREIALGRHRRAAYIFAELLGELTSAANALENGGHYREAALLYQERLSQPLQAARCLAKGRLWTEAIAVYEKLGEHEQVGDLYVELRDEDLASQAYYAAIKKHSLSGDYLNAARIAEQKLEDVESAYVILSGQWPDSRQAARCLEEMFALLARHQRHDVAEHHVRLLAEQPLPDAAPLQAIERLSKLATDYPHPPLRTLAADRTRVMAARRLEQELPGEMSALLQAVRRLAPGDRLLGRDTDRYSQQKGRAQKKAPRSVGLSVLVGYHLPRGIAWEAAVALEQSFYAAGWRGGNEIVIAYLDSSDNIQLAPTTWRLSADGGRLGGELLMAAHPSDQTTVYLHPAGRSPLDHELLMPLVSRTSNSAAGRVRISPHPGLTRDTQTMHYENCSLMSGYVDYRTQEICLSYFSANDQLIATAPIDIKALLEDRIMEPIRLRAIDNKTIIAAGQLLIIHDAGNLTCEHFAYRIKCIATQCQFAIGMEQGAILFWDNRLNGRRENFAHDLASPMLAFLESGHLIAAAENVVEVYATHGSQLRLVGKQQAQSAAPLAIIAGKQPYQFRVIFTDGRVRVYQIAVSA